MVEGIKLAKKEGLKVGIVTNSYWATCVEDADIWLKDISELSIDDLSVSNASFRYENMDDSLSKIAEKASNNFVGS